jgi:hypothetical protein
VALEIPSSETDVVTPLYPLTMAMTPNARDTLTDKESSSISKIGDWKVAGGNIYSHVSETYTPMQKWLLFAHPKDLPHLGETRQNSFDNNHLGRWEASEDTGIDIAS